MTDSLRERNLSVLRQRMPALHQALDRRGSYQVERDVLIQTSTSGDPTMSICGRLVHSRVDPRKEGHRLAALAEGDGPVVIFGFGLGYAAEAVEAERPIIVVERDPLVFEAALRSRDLTDFLSRPSLAFVIGGAIGSRPTDIAAALDAYGGVPALLANKTLRELDAAWYDEAEKIVRAWGLKDEVNTATLRRFGTRWVRNLAANLDAIRDLPGIARLAGFASGYPAMLVAAGPSLDDQLPLMPLFADRCLIICADTALRALLTSGVEPDFVLVVDPQYWNFRHLDHCPAQNSVLITESATYPSVLRARFKRRFLCSSLFPLGAFIEEATDPKGTLGAGGSVATTAWDFARVVGAAPLWFSGLDLGFPDLKTHFKGAMFEERSHALCGRTDTVESRAFSALRSGHPFVAPRAGGGSVLTDKRLSLYGAWFEARFRSYPAYSPRSLSSGGIRIDGMPLADTREILDLAPRRKKIEEIKREAFDRIDSLFNEPNEKDRRAVAFTAAEKSLVEALRELEALAKEGMRAASSNNREAMLPILDEINQRIENSAAKQVAGFLFRVPVENERSDVRERYFDYSMRLYGNLSDSVSFNLALLRKRKR